MISIRTKFFAALFTSFMAVAGIAAFAWACSPQATKLTFFPEAGPARTNLSVTGAGFMPGQVEVRWNSSEGRLIGNGTVDPLGKVVANAVIPAAAPSVNYVVVLQRVPGKDLIFSKATQIFEVTNGSAKASPQLTNTDLWQGFADQEASSFPSAPAPAAPQSDGSGMKLGYGLLGIGAAGVAGFAVVSTLRKRRQSSVGH